MKNNFSNFSNFFNKFKQADQVVVTDEEVEQVVENPYSADLAEIKALLRRLAAPAPKAAGMLGYDQLQADLGEIKGLLSQLLAVQTDVAAASKRHHPH
jgi:hypothetical protein